ncbi:KH domain-containing protein [Candidatus Woesearchaeota archaeon]|nr:KH domain-containing protein [Candidatus Woesearchaeota archaeon]
MINSESVVASDNSGAVGSLLVKDHDVVVPGQVLANGLEFLPSYGSYRDGDSIIASVLGLLELRGKVLRIIPLAGKYFPKAGDKIIARVIDILMTGWRVEFGSAYSGVLNLKEATSRFVERDEDLTKILGIGDFIVAGITNVTSQNLVDITTRGQGLGPLRGGRIITVGTSKVPRIIGKEGSMVKLLRDSTGCNITVGQNGWIWIDGSPDAEIKMVGAIVEIENNAHVSGLTDHIQKFLEGLR